MTTATETGRQYQSILQRRRELAEQLARIEPSAWNPAGTERRYSVSQARRREKLTQEIAACDTALRVL